MRLILVFLAALLAPFASAASRRASLLRPPTPYPRVAFAGRPQSFITTFLFRASAVCVLMAAVALPSQAVTTSPLLHPLFTNNMVLQRDASDPVWGWADPGTTITVTVYDQTDAVLQTKT